MENNQKIKCTVCSCQYNQEQDCNCQLNEITVRPCQNQDSGKTDDTLCSNYKCK